MGNRYSFVECPQLECSSDITIRYHVSLFKLTNSKMTFKEPYTVTSFTHNGETVLCVHAKRNGMINYKICTALFNILSENGTIHNGVTYISIENDTEFIITYNDGRTDRYTKHINIGSCFRDNNHYLIKKSSSLNRKMSSNSSISDSSDER